MTFNAIKICFPLASFRLHLRNCLTRNGLSQKRPKIGENTGKSAGLNFISMSCNGLGVFLQLCVDISGAIGEVGRVIRHLLMQSQTTIHYPLAAITTRYAGPTNSRGSRIIVSCQTGRKTYSYDHAAHCAHASAFRQFLTDKPIVAGWSDAWAHGVTEKGEHVFTPIHSAKETV